MALRRQIPYLDSAGFLRELDVCHQPAARPAHLSPRQRRRSVAHAVRRALPFLVEVFGEYRTPTYIVTKVSDDVTDLDFGAGAAHHVERDPVRTTGRLRRDPDRRAARRLGAPRALETLTQRPLEFLRPICSGSMSATARRRPRRTIGSLDPLQAAGHRASKAITAPEAVELRTPGRRRDERSRPPRSQAAVPDRPLGAGSPGEPTGSEGRGVDRDDVPRRDFSATAPYRTRDLRLPAAVDVRRRAQRPVLRRRSRGYCATCRGKGLIIDLRSNPVASSTPPSDCCNCSPGSRSSRSGYAAPRRRWPRSPRPTPTAPICGLGRNHPHRASISARSSCSTCRSATRNAATDTGGVSRAGRRRGQCQHVLVRRHLRGGDR